jgi:hypothetical protein
LEQYGANKFWGHLTAINYETQHNLVLETILTLVRAAEISKFGACKWLTHVDAGIANFSSV